MPLRDMERLLGPRNRMAGGNVVTVMQARHRLMIVVLSAAALLAGCGTADEATAPGVSVSPTSDAASSGPADASAGATPVGTPSRSQPTPPAQPGLGQVTVTGNVVQGVEPGCMLLQADDKLYLLLGGDRSLIEGSTRLTVKGTPQPDLMTTCQQGLPFQVTEARPA